jgi:hypothetical protein
VSTGFLTIWCMTNLCDFLVQNFLEARIASRRHFDDYLAGREKAKPASLPRGAGTPANLR